MAVSHSTPKTILFLSEFLWTTGERRGVQVVYRTLEGYRDAGYRVRLLVPATHRRRRRVRYDGMEIESVYVDVWPFGGECDYLGYRPTRPAPPILSSLLWRVTVLIFTLKAALRGIEICRSRDVALVYGFCAFSCPAAYLIGMIAGVPVVTRLIGTKLFARALERPFGRWAHHLWWLATACARDLLILTNDGSRSREACLRVGVDEGRIRFWLDAVARSPFRAKKDASWRKRLGIPLDAVVIGMLTQLVRYRGVHRAVRAMSRVVKSCPGARLVIAGAGPERQALAEQVRDLGLGDAVLFLGDQPWSEAPRLLKCVDICVACGDGSNLPNSILEAMVAGRCVVARNTGGLEGTLKDGENCRLVEPDEGEALGRVLAELAGDSKLRRALGRNAAQWAKENVPDWPDRMAMEIGTVEKEVLRRAAPTGQWRLAWVAALLAFCWFAGLSIAYYARHVDLIRKFLRALGGG